MITFIMKIVVLIVLKMKVLMFHLIVHRIKLNKNLEKQEHKILILKQKNQISLDVILL